jgi:RES domain-containing protein
VAADADDLSLFAASEQRTAQVSQELVAFRYCSYDVPFWVRPNSRPGRWHVVGGDPTQYWSLTPEGAWAELIRYEELSTEEELDEIRTAIWVCRLPRMGLADLADDAVRDRYNLTSDDLVADAWDACQHAAAEIRRDARGVLAPSAALADTLNVTLFGPRRVIAFHRTAGLASAIPGAITAIGRPPRGLVGRVQRRTHYPTLF